MSSQILATGEAVTAQSEILLSQNAVIVEMADSYNQLLGLGSHSANANLRAWLLLTDNAANTTVDDASPVNDDGVLQGGDNTADITGTPGAKSFLPRALTFDGTNDYIDGITAPVIGTGAYTILVRVKTSATSVNDGQICHWGSGLAGKMASWSIESGAIWGRFISNTVSGGSGLSDNAWHNIAIIKPADATPSGVILRADKTAITETPSGSSTLNPDTDNFGIAGRVASSQRLAGSMNEFTVFLNALTDAESDEWEDGPEPVNSVAPAISGTETQGETLSVTTGTWGLPSPLTGTNGTITYAYQWTRSDDGTGTNEADISGATSSTYTLVGDDVGSYIRCRVRASNDGGYDAAADTNSDFSGAIAASGSPPTNSVAPAVSGSLIEGYTLTTTEGTWSDGSLNNIKWQVADDGIGTNAADISGATSSTYQLPLTTSIGKYFRSGVRYTNGTLSDYAYSDWEGPVAEASESITLTGTFSLTINLGIGL